MLFLVAEKYSKEEGQFTFLFQTSYQMVTYLVQLRK